MLSIPIMEDSSREDLPRRSSSRKRIDTLVYADFGPGNGGFPINISKGGLAFQGIQPLEKGQVVSAKFKLPSTTELVEISGQIVWLNELGKGGGLQFTDLPEDSRQTIEKWLSLQVETENEEDVAPVRARKSEQKPLRPAPAVELAVREGITAVNAALKTPRSVLSSITAVEGDARNKLAGSPPRPKAEWVGPQAAETKRFWILPFSFGMVASAAVMVAILSFYGVISIQFRWPQKGTGGAVAPPIATAAAKATESPTPPAGRTGIDRLVPSSTPAVSPSVNSDQDSTAQPVPRLAKSPESFPAKSVVSAKIVLPKTPLEKLMTTKPLVPSPVKPAAQADVQPPSFANPPKSDPAGQLSMISPKSASPAPPAPVRQSGKYDSPQLITRKDPVFPEAAKQAGISGSVELQFTITPEGKVRDVSVVNGNPMLTRAAIDAVQAWRYSPARLGGIPVEAQTNTIINFKSN